MVVDEGAVKSCFSVNHGAGRQLGRIEAIRQLDQQTIYRQFDADD
jgi:tRNA-splicing ligase RtcB (3'-phosphate/5'-hydroxy nucleic acid ligase)